MIMSISRLNTEIKQIFFRRICVRSLLPVVAPLASNSAWHDPVLVLAIERLRTRLGRQRGRRMGRWRGHTSRRIRAAQDADRARDLRSVRSLGSHRSSAGVCTVTMMRVSERSLVTYFLVFPRDDDLGTRLVQTTALLSLLGALLGRVWAEGGGEVVWGVWHERLEVADHSFTVSLVGSLGVGIVGVVTRARSRIRHSTHATMQGVKRRIVWKGIERQKINLPGTGRTHVLTGDIP